MSTVRRAVIGEAHASVVDDPIHPHQEERHPHHRLDRLITFETCHIWNHCHDAVLRPGPERERENHKLTWTYCATISITLCSSTTFYRLSLLTPLQNIPHSIILSTTLVICTARDGRPPTGTLCLSQCQRTRPSGQE